MEWNEVEYNEMKCNEMKCNEINVLKVEKKIRFWKYLQLLDIEITIPNLESLRIQRQSVLDFQMRFFTELGHLLLTKIIFIERNNSFYTYIFRITDHYALNNISKIKPLGDFILNDFSFRYTSRKRKIFRNEETFEVSKKMNLLNIDENNL